MKKYMILAKNDYNEEIFYTDIKVEMKHAFDRMIDKYKFVKVFCLGANGVYKDTTELNEQTLYQVRRYSGTFIGIYGDEDSEKIMYKDEEWQEFTNESEAMLYIINSMKAGYKCKLYKNGRRDWRV